MFSGPVGKFDPDSGIAFLAAPAHLLVNCQVPMKRAQILVGVTSCLSAVAGGLLAFFSVAGLILSLPPRSAIAWAWWSLSLSILAVVLAQAVLVLGALRQGIGLALGFHIPVMAIAPTIIVLMVLRLLVFYL
jgi:hypothetical protein